MFLTHPANGSALAPALATTRAEPAVFDNGAAPSDPNADFDDGPGNTPQADVITCTTAPLQQTVLSHIFVPSVRLFSQQCQCI